MSIAEKLTTISDNVQKVYDAGYEKGKSEGGSINLLYYATSLNNIFGGAVFPENFEAVIKVRKAPVNCGAMCHQVSNLKTIKIISEDNTNIVDFSQSCRVTAYTPCLELVDLSEFNPTFKLMREAFRGQRKLKSILGTLDVSECTTLDSLSNIVFECDVLEEIRFTAGSIKTSIHFYTNGALSDASVNSIIDGLADLTGSTAQIISFHSNILDKLTTEQFNAIAAKNWTMD